MWETILAKGEAFALATTERLVVGGAETGLNIMGKIGRHEVTQKAAGLVALGLKNVAESPATKELGKTVAGIGSDFIGNTAEKVMVASAKGQSTTTVAIVEHFSGEIGELKAQIHLLEHQVRSLGHEPLKLMTRQAVTAAEQVTNVSEQMGKVSLKVAAKGTSAAHVAENQASFASKLPVFGRLFR